MSSQSSRPTKIISRGSRWRVPPLLTRNQEVTLISATYRVLWHTHAGIRGKLSLLTAKRMTFTKLQLNLETLNCWKSLTLMSFMNYWKGKHTSGPGSSEMVDWWQNKPTKPSWNKQHKGHFNAFCLFVCLEYVKKPSKRNASHVKAINVTTQPRQTSKQLHSIMLE